MSELLIRSIKLIDICYIFTIYFIISIGLSVLVDNYLGKFDPEKYRNTPHWKIILETLAGLWLFGISFYIIRNVVELIPFPLDGYGGFNHRRMKELNSTWVFGFIFLSCNSYVKDRLNFFINDIRNFF